MKKRSSSPWVDGQARLVLIVLFVLALTSATVYAQQQPVRPRFGLPADKADAAQTLEAQHVAGKLGLSQENTTKLVAAYKAARKAYGEAIRSNRSNIAKPEEGAPVDRQARMKARREQQQKATAEACETLRKAVSAFLNENQTKTAVEKLGIFDMQWDMMVDTLAGFKLGEKQDKALELVNGYVVERAKTMATLFSGSGDTSGLREKLTGMSAKLDQDLAAILSEEQLAKWKETTTMGPGRGMMPGREGAAPPRPEPTTESVPGK